MGTGSRFDSPTDADADAFPDSDEAGPPSAFGRASSIGHDLRALLQLGVGYAANLRDGVPNAAVPEIIASARAIIATAQRAVARLDEDEQPRRPDTGDDENASR